jgi:hypothetical protein
MPGGARGPGGDHREEQVNRIRFAIPLACLLLPAAARGQGPEFHPATAPASLVYNGEFSALAPKAKTSDPDWPAGWTSKHPGNIKLFQDPGLGRRVIEMTGDEGLMGGYGVDLLSAPIDFKPNTRYRVTGRTKSAGPNLIVFVKGYATVTHTVEGQPRTEDAQVYQMRKEIAPGAAWRAFNLDFAVRPVETFSQFQHQVKYLRVELWAYWPKGTCWCDGIGFEEAGPLPDAARLPAQAVTHMGTKPRLAADSAPAGAFDEEQTFLDAANAFNDGEDQTALKLAEQLVAHRGDQADYRVLAARVLSRLGRHDEAEGHARWLMAQAPEAWQRDWGRVVAAGARWHAGDGGAARALLAEVKASADSANARQAADTLLRQMDAPATQP